MGAPPGRASTKVVLKWILETFRFGTRTTTKTRFNFYVCFAYLKENDTPESFIVHFLTRKKLTRLFFLKVVKPSAERKKIKLLTFDNLFPPQRLSR